MYNLKNIYLKKTEKDNYSHPWIYKNHIDSADPAIMTGDLVRVFMHNNFYIGTGYYNPNSNIAVRILSHTDEEINKDFFANCISEAVIKRNEIKKISNAYRLIFSEADNLPGIIADIYDNTLVLQITTSGMDRLKKIIISALSDLVNPEFIYEKSDIESRKLEGLQPVSEWHGKKGKAKVLINEGKARFIVDIVNGHKTGFYLDQRKTRLAAGALAKGKRILDVFCYTGGFSVHTAMGKASEVTGIDTKNKWLLYAKENASLNNIPCPFHTVKGNAFTIMREYIHQNRFFDMIVLDPPSFVKNKHRVKTALKGYLEINRYAMKLLTEGGILCTFSCSHHIYNDFFSDMLKKAASLENKSLSIIKRCHQDKDHPIIRQIPETEYLKGYFLKIDPIG